MVNCAFCGFLALRGEDGGFIEVDEQYRFSVLPHPDAPTYKAVYEAKVGLPLCFMRKACLPVEILKQPEWGTENQGAVQKTVVAERDCDGWTQWQQGFTPKEHREMLDRKEFRDWQEKQRRSDIKWRIIEIVILGFVVTLMAGAFTVLGAFIERGTLFPTP